jgi:hypothetical protein
MKRPRKRCFSAVLIRLGRTLPAAIFGLCLTLLAATSVLSPCFGQEKPQESVTVTAVEVPVRVFDKNGFIGGLAKDDFEVFENGVKQDITGFEAVSRTISPVPVAMPEAVPQAPRKRNFLLIFNVWDYTGQVGEAIDYFFKNIFSPGDRILILIEDKFFKIDTGAGIEHTVSELKGTLIRFKKASRYEISRAFLNLDVQATRLVALYIDEMNGPEGRTEDSWQATQLFFDEYRRIWLDYRDRMLDPDRNLYRSAVKVLNRADGEKWAICFQQRDLFPQLRSSGNLERSLRDDWWAQILIMQMRKEMDIVRNYPQNAIREIFADANITFHLLLMKSIASRASNESRELELGDVDAEYENTLRGISRATGGLTVFSNKVAETLKEAAAKEDRHYLIVYQSKGSSGVEERKIEVRVHREDAEVVSLKRFVGKKQTAVSISDFEAKGKNVAFDIAGCGRLEQGARNSGKVRIAVTVFDEKSIKVFNETKAFDLIADSIHLSLSFDKLATGTHFLIIEAVDLVTGDKDVYSCAINW